MMAIKKALDEVKFRIPRPVLEAVFVKRLQNWRQSPVGLDEQIMNEVVRPRVLVDASLVGGVEDTISLEGMTAERPTDYVSVYRIPKSKTGGRSIQSVLNITYSDPTRMANHGVIAPHQNTAMLNLGAAVMNVHGSLPQTSTARVNLIGENVVMVRDTVVLPANIYLRCVLAYDENMSDIQPRSYPAFSNLVTFAVKAYIYNEYIIEMDMGQLHGGQQLGRFSEVINGFAEAEELYQTELREKWQKVAFMNDHESYTRLLRQVIGGNR